ncbi:MAG: amidohydrolase family protein [Treponema sp.]|jgi:N-acyl-D-aspartate/D-glutamate deacylase|nr:amidohydrolase family protein [Treponema sp.]
MTLIKNALIADGGGGNAFAGDILINGEYIEAIAPDLGSVPGTERIAATGLYALPGFIDIHRHGDLIPFAGGGTEELRQGITTFINGNCGFSAVPSSRQNFPLLRHYALPVIGAIPERFAGMGFAEFRRELEGCALRSHIGYLCGGGALRIAVKGFEPGPLSAAEQDRIGGLLQDELDAGVFGLSLGLMYAPENYYSMEELAKLCEIPAKQGRIVTAHLWGEGKSLPESVDKIIRLARRSGASFHISHLKAAGRSCWKTRIPGILEKIRTARDGGLDISFDVYPYTAASTSLVTLLPPALQQGGVERMLDRLREPTVRAETAAALRTEQSLWDNLALDLGWDRIVPGRGRESGKTIAEIAEERGQSGEECVFDLLLENRGNVPIFLYSMCEEDVETILAEPGVIVASDAIYPEDGTAHPRRYGAHARFLSRYAGKKGFEQALQSVTALPAERFGLKTRGRLRKNAVADILLVDRDRLRDTADYADPARLPEGIVMAMVAGRPSFFENKREYNAGGKLLLAQKG